jgi:hypothetical protein
MYLSYEIWSLAKIYQHLGVNCIIFFSACEGIVLLLNELEKYCNGRYKLGNGSFRITNLLLIVLIFDTYFSILYYVLILCWSYKMVNTLSTLPELMVRICTSLASQSKYVGKISWNIYPVDTWILTWTFISTPIYLITKCPTDYLYITTHSPNPILYECKEKFFKDSFLPLTLRFFLPVFIFLYRNLSRNVPVTILQSPSLWLNVKNVFFIMIERNRKTRKDTQLLLFVLGLYPLLCILLFYMELEQLIVRLWGTRTFDEPLIRIEEYLFGCQPAVALRELFPNRIIGEFLHLCYFSLYFIIATTIVFARFYSTTGTHLPSLKEHQKKTDDDEKSVNDVDQIHHPSLTPYDFVVSLVFLTCLCCWVLHLSFPAKGPTAYFPRPPPEQVGFFFSFVARNVVSSGASLGTAFPSTHCAFSLACWLSLHDYLCGANGVTYLYGMFVPGLLIATMWCGFHYFVDSLCGVTVALSMYLLHDRLIVFCRQK